MKILMVAGIIRPLSFVSKPLLTSIKLVKYVIRKSGYQVAMSGIISQTKGCRFPVATRAISMFMDENSSETTGIALYVVSTFKIPSL